jgi:hypothetical protein
MKKDVMVVSKRVNWIIAAALLVAGICASVVLVGALSQSAPGASAANPPPQASTTDKYIVLTWNDLGMHCYNWDFSDLAVLPPYNTLWAQVVKVGNPPQIITSGITVTYAFTNNTYSVGKSNFWTYAQKLFSLTVPLPDNIGLTGRGLSGAMSREGSHFVAEGIPLTEFTDQAPTTRDPYQLARIVARGANGQILAENTVVAPVSTEMHCDYCHYDNGPGNEGVATGKIERNILTQHDRENMDEYPPGHQGALMNRRPVLCAECHATNALAMPGVPGIPSLSRAMHDKHKDKVPATLDGCYNCHPGPNTKCLRDVMSQRGMDCIDCHGPMSQVAQNPNPWLNEPRCDTCHNDGKHQQNNALYRFSSEHGGIYCEACHDSTHAIAPSTQPRDAIKFVALQGHAGTLDTCAVCHSTIPAGGGPHGEKSPVTPRFTLAPDHSSVSEPGTLVVYLHSLQNTGNISDTYNLTWSRTQDWSTVSASLAGIDVTVPGTVTMLSGQTLLLTATVNIPAGESVRGLVDRTSITTTSSVNLALVQSVTDITLVPRAKIFLPLVFRN